MIMRVVNGCYLLTLVLVVDELDCLKSLWQNLFLNLQEKMKI